MYFLLKLLNDDLWYCGNGLFCIDKEEAEKYYNLDDAEISHDIIKKEYGIKTKYDCYNEDE